MFPICNFSSFPPVSKEDTFPHLFILKYVFYFVFKLGNCIEGYFCYWDEGTTKQSREQDGTAPCVCVGPWCVLDLGEKGSVQMLIAHEVHWMILKQSKTLNLTGVVLKTINAILSFLEEMKNLNLWVITGTLIPFTLFSARNCLCNEDIFKTIGQHPVVLHSRVREIMEAVVDNLLAFRCMHAPSSHCCTSDPMKINPTLCLIILTHTFFSLIGFWPIHVNVGKCGNVPFWIYNSYNPPASVDTFGSSLYNRTPLSTALGTESLTHGLKIQALIAEQGKKLEIHWGFSRCNDQNWAVDETRCCVI